MDAVDRGFATVYTPLSSTEFLTAQVREIHARRGTFYLTSFLEPRLMDSRTILSVGPMADDPGHFRVALSDGTTAVVADFIKSTDEAGDVVRVELRAADGSLSGDGPVLTDAIRAEFVALGVDPAGIPVASPALVLVRPESFGAVADPAETPSAPTPALATGVHVDAGDHEEATHLLSTLFPHLERELHDVLHRVAALLHMTWSA